ncbi:MAG: hypothetical protein IPL49_21945 [Saprospirales bacterium]|nr:hypothetical protein [Saprospirales bacterium]
MRILKLAGVSDAFFGDIRPVTKYPFWSQVAGVTAFSTCQIEHQGPVGDVNSSAGHR